VADPYRWLEDPADPRAEAWSQAEDELARLALDAPGRDRLTERLTEQQRTGSVRARTGAATVLFTCREPDQEHEALLVREADGHGAGRPDRFDPAGTMTLDARAEHRGRLAAYQLSTGRRGVPALRPRRATGERLTA
jgi:prolyl oligopeptidase